MIVGGVGWVGWGLGWALRVLRNICSSLIRDGCSTSVLIVVGWASVAHFSSFMIVGGVGWVGWGLGWVLGGRIWFVDGG